MTRKCPACSTIVPVKGEDVCPQCGAKLKSYFRGMTEEEQALYVRKLALAMRKGGSSRTRVEEATTPGPVRQSELGRVDPIPLLGSRQEVYSRNIPVPILDRDGTEDSEEPKARIENHPRVIPLESGLEEPPSEPVSQVWKEPVTGMNLIRVEAGCYLMGAGEWDGQGYSHEKPVHEVCLDGFWMGMYSVTQGEWKKVMGSNPSSFKLGDGYPVECVSWLDARQFIKKLSSLNDELYAFRLPTEAEWEYACRSGGRPEKYAGCAEEDDLDELAWHARNSGSVPHQVGAGKPNGLGLYDMSGNVWEWCEDIYSDTAYDRHERSNPACCTGELDRVIRGGSWYTDPDSVRCSSRGFLDQTYRRHFVGFRLVRAR